MIRLLCGNKYGGLSMNSINFFGNTKMSISDSLFNSKNIEYIHIFYTKEEAFTRKPEARGEIVFISNDVEGRKNFKDSSIMEVIAQMAEFIDTLK